MLLAVFAASMMLYENGLSVADVNGTSCYKQ
jgi:hypothetical protein